MCVKCKHRVFFDPITKVLYYMDDGCNKVPLPADAQVGGTDGSGVPIGGGADPSLPPPEDLPTDISGAMPCYKATGVWTVIEDFMDALILSGAGGLSHGGEMYKDFQQNYGGALNADNYQLWLFSFDHYTDDPDIGIAWNEHKDAVKADFICAAQDAFEKFPLLTSGDKEWLFAYDFDSPSAVLDDFMTDVLKVPEKVVWGQAASYHALSQIGECDCVGGEVPPPDPEVPEGFGRIEVAFGAAFNNNVFPEAIASPTAFMEGTEHAGELLSATSIGSTHIASLSDNQAISALFIAPDGVVIKHLKFTFAWAGEADPSREFDVSYARAGTAADSFTAISESHAESETNVTPTPNIDIDVSASNPRYLWANFAGYGTEPADTGAILMSEIRFDIAAADGSWTRNAVPLGTLFQL